MANTNSGSGRKPVTKAKKEDTVVEELVESSEVTMEEKEEVKEMETAETVIKDSKDLKIEALEKQIQELMMLMLKKQSGGEDTLNTSNPRSSDDVKIVHLVERAPGLKTHIKLSNLVINMTSFGEERTLTLSQFEELVGMYRSWFEQGIIAPGAGLENLASRYGLKTVKDYNISKEFITKLGIMNIYELEAFFTKLGEGHRQFILEYWQRRVIAKDPAFKDVHKIEMLNRVSNGGLRNVLLDLETEKERERIAAAKK